MSIATRFKSHPKSSIALGIVLVLVLAVVAFAWTKKIAPASWGLFGEINASGGVAIEGYDPVAYFAAGEAKKGNPEYTYRWKEVSWQFVSDENRKLFEANPEKYAPQHGGYCALAADSGVTAASDPTAWAINPSPKKTPKPAANSSAPAGSPASPVIPSPDTPPWASPPWISLT